MLIISTDQINNEMNKLISTENRIFMCICGASGSGKTHLLLNMLTSRSDGIFWPRFEKVILFYRHWQTIFEQFYQDVPSKVFFENVVETENETGLAKLGNQKHQTPGHKTSHSRIDTLISKLSDHQSQESKYHTTFGNEKALAIFDDSCEEILQSANFANLATAGRHKGVNVIFIKHNLYQQGKYCVTVDKNTTQLIILKSPRIGRQLRLLGSELEIADAAFLQDAYQLATSVPHGHLLKDLSTNCHDALRFSTRICRASDDITTLIKQNKQRSKVHSTTNITQKKEKPDSRILINLKKVLPTGFYVPKKLFSNYARVYKDHTVGTHNITVNRTKNYPIIAFPKLSPSSILNREYALYSPNHR